jgi:hypothetical protein
VPERTAMNYKRRRPRSSPTHHRRARNYDNAPRWWDVICNRRPARRREAILLTAVKQGCDPDNVAWNPSGRPYNYYW